MDNLFAKDGQASSPMSDDSTLRSVSSESTSSKEASTSWISAYADQKEKQKKKHRKKKKKKKGREVFDTLSDTLLDRDCKSGNLMAELMKCTEDVISVNGILWVYDEVCGCYKCSSENEISTKIYTLLSEEDRLKI